MNRENFLESRLEDEQKISAHMYNNGLRAFSTSKTSMGSATAPFTQYAGS